jgi:hypothetical protein
MDDFFKLAAKAEGGIKVAGYQPKFDTRTLGRTACDVGATRRSRSFSPISKTNSNSERHSLCGFGGAEFHNVKTDQDTMCFS